MKSIFPENTIGSLKIDMSYAAVNLGSSTLWFFVNGWLMYYYLLPGREIELISVTFFGIATFISRAMDIVMDLPNGYLSDHTHSRWGRRLPYMFFASLVMPCLFILLWLPPRESAPVLNLVYLTAILLLFNLTYSLQQIPYRALLPELASSDQHRVQLSAWQAGFQLVGVIVAGLAGWFIASFGYLKAAALYAVGTLPLFFLPFLVLREKPERQILASERISLKISLATALKNRAFISFVIASSLYWIASTLILETIPFIVTQICGLSEADTVYFYIPAVLITLICFPLVTWLSNRLGKWKIFAGSLLASAVVLPGLALIGNWFPVPLMAQGIVWILLESVAMSGAQVLPSAIIAEITDKDQELTGQRREGLYYATWSLFGQIASMAAAALIPLTLLLGRSRSDLYGPLGVRMLGVLGGVFLLIAFLMLCLNPSKNTAHPEAH